MLTVVVKSESPHPKSLENSFRETIHVTSTLLQAQIPHPHIELRSFLFVICLHLIGLHVYFYACRFTQNLAHETEIYHIQWLIRGLSLFLECRQTIWPRSSRQIRTWAAGRTRSRPSKKGWTHRVQILRSSGQSSVDRWHISVRHKLLSVRLNHCTHLCW